MLTLQGKNIYLRALEPTDIDFLYRCENDESVWELSDTQAPYSRYTLEEYLKNAHQDIYQIKQLRLSIVKQQTDEILGFVDFFDFNPKNKRAGIGILILNSSHRNRGMGFECLQLVIGYAWKHLQLHQLYANILCENTASIRLFTKCGFKKSGVKKDWIYSEGSYKDEMLFQLLNKTNGS